MNPAFLYLTQWESLQESAQLSAAHQLVKQLPSGFVFNRLETYALGDQKHPVAFFDWKPTHWPQSEHFHGAFVLIPGATVTLGYDREHPFRPTTAQWQSWQGTQGDFGAPDLHTFLDQCMTPLRTIELKPFLMEVGRVETKFEATPISKLPPSYQSRLQFHFSEEAIAEDVNVGLAVKSPQEIVAESRQHGFRMLTSDEWEWACSAGSRTLWRWGNECPTDGYPSECHKRDLGWDLHTRPNAFGVKIADDDYNPEYCEDYILRGGDGGGMTCGGAGYLIAWLLLASSYFEQGPEISDDLGSIEVKGDRRIYPLG